MDDTKKTLISKYNEFIELAESSTKSANSIKEVLRILGYDIDKNNNDPISKVSNSNPDFPIDGSKRVQAVWLIRKLGKASKMTDIQNLYTEKSGKDDDIQMTVRTLKISKIISNKSYGNSKEAYWGLTEWYDGEDFKEEYKPEI